MPLLQNSIHFCCTEQTRHPSEGKQIVHQLEEILVHNLQDEEEKQQRFNNKFILSLSNLD